MLSKEHFLSKPICDLFRIDRAGGALGRVDGNSRTIESVARLEDTSVRIACKVCNESWMSDLETGTAQALRALLDDGVLDEGAVVRRWLMKTHLLLMFIDGGARRIMDKPADVIIPDATAGRLLYEGADQFDRYRLTIGAAPTRDPKSFRYAFGTPAIEFDGLDRVNVTAATVTILDLYPLRFIVAGSTLTPASVVQPGVNIVDGLRLRHLPEGRRGLDHTSAWVTFGKVAALELQALAALATGSATPTRRPG